VTMIKHVRIVVPANILILLLLPHVQIVMLHVMNVKIMLMVKMINVLHVKQLCKKLQLMV
jgi:hypothetical protein